MLSLLRISLSELWKGRRRLFFPALALLIAVAGLLVLRGLQTQIGTKLLNEGRNQMGADIEVEFHTPIPEADLDQIIEILPEGTALAGKVELNTMLQIPNEERGRYVRLTAIENGYPFYGDFNIEGRESFLDLDAEESFVFLPADLAQELDVRLGDTIRFGKAAFNLAGIVQGGGGLSGFISFAPRAWIHRSKLESTELLFRPGRRDYEYGVKLPPSVEATAAAETLKEAFEEQGYEIEAFDGADRGFQRFFNRVSLFGQLVAIAALLLSGVTIFGCFQNWFFERRYLIAILRALGARRRQIATLMYSSLIFFSVSIALLGTALGWLAFYFLQPLVMELLNFNLPARLSGTDIGFSMLVGTIFPLVFGSLALSETNAYKPIILLRSSLLKTSFGKTRLFAIALLVLILAGFIWFLLSSLAQSFVITASLLGFFVLGCLFNFGLLYSFRFVERFRLPLWIQYPFRSLLREKWLSVLSACLFFILSLVLSTMVSIENILVSEFLVDEEVQNKNVFVLDIGEEKKSQIDQALQDKQDIKLNWAPWVQVRWVDINGVPLEELADQDEFFRVEYLVTETLKKTPQDRIVAGEFWKEAYQGEGLPEVSLTRRTAQRYDIDIGDELRFKMYGIPFEAKVTNFRRVRWTDFEPGFRIVFQKGVFEGAPFSYLASVETLTDEARVEVRRLLSRDFPEVSTVDIAPLKEDLVRILGDLRVALATMLSLLFLIAAVLLFVLAQEKISSRRTEYATLKCLGARSAWLRLALSIEFVAISLAPTVLGVLLGSFAAQQGLYFFLNVETGPFFGPQVYLPLVTLVIILATAWWGTRDLKTLKPLETL